MRFSTTSWSRKSLPPSPIRGRANGNAASLPYVDTALRDDPTVYPTEEVLDRDSPRDGSGAGLRA